VRPATLLLLLLAGSAAAAPSAQERAAARAAFAAGETAFAQHDYELALQRFRRAFTLAPHDAVRFNVAMCLERLARFREATLEYEAAASSTDLRPHVRRRARELADKARVRLGTLFVHGQPVGAAVVVDGAHLGTLPCRLLVDARVHDVVVRSGAIEERRRVEVTRGGAVTVEITLPTSLPVLVAQRAEIAQRPAGPGLLTWVGGGVALAGAGGAIAFGLRARSLHDDFVATPTSGTRDDGVLMRNLANVSLAVAVAGAATALVDLVWLRPRRAARP
jgi:hypothetical protein